MNRKYKNMEIKEFYKMQASGNDFILIDERQKSEARAQRYRSLAQEWCERKFGIGADGLLVIESSIKADFKMRIFNSDGSEAGMCGNGARCAALWADSISNNKKSSAIKFETKAGIIEAQVFSPLRKAENSVKIKMSDPLGIRFDVKIKVFARKMRVNLVNTGVPHAVVFVQGIDNIDVEKIGSQIRYHKEFAPAGVNVDFVEVIKEDFIKIRTYERGVEAETLSCGTGSAASAIISMYKLSRKSFFNSNGKNQYQINVSTKSGEVLSVYFNRNDKDKIIDVWLKGKAYLVYKGEMVFV